MALTKEDKIYLEKTFATKAELHELGKEMFGEVAKMVTKDQHKEDLLRLELLMENRFDELRRMLGDILDWVKEIPAHRERLNGHDTAIGRLNQTVYGYDPNQPRLN